MSFQSSVVTHYNVSALNNNDPGHGPFASDQKERRAHLPLSGRLHETGRSKRAVIFDYRAMVLLAYPAHSIDSVQVMNFAWAKGSEGP